MNLHTLLGDFQTGLTPIGWLVLAGIVWLVWSSVSEASGRATPGQNGWSPRDSRGVTYKWTDE